MEGDFSPSWLYAEWAAGRGPKRVRIGGKVKILETPREYCERVAREHLGAITVEHLPIALEIGRASPAP
jgi:hypothetical protein